MTDRGLERMEFDIICFGLTRLFAASEESRDLSCRKGCIPQRLLYIRWRPRTLIPRLPLYFSLEERILQEAVRRLTVQYFQQSHQDICRHQDYLINVINSNISMCDGVSKPTAEVYLSRLLKSVQWEHPIPSSSGTAEVFR